MPRPAGLRTYYFVRAGVAAVWVAAAFTLGKAAPSAAAALLIAYPAWDAIANLIDVSRNGGMARNRPQALNVAVSGITAVAVAMVIANMNAVLGVFGAWAILAGLLQLSTGVRRWKSFGAQWAMILSGAQSALAGGIFIKQAFENTVPGIEDVAPYAAFGAFYFATSALWLLFRRAA
ncbi:DUF308 domain-containing protein [Sphingomonas sp. JC676]|uniref:DUF308 domain-containing protein n=1 Tax=Sphingomonas sp. JC676 TaxID=2768065 RepID=UPI001657C6E1|nr:DUF308 domain-containing protein [Sphingomonas sp. JC676]MBC9031882.1 DUF308 domain-containing protein [Sphingomonas sp. JC676]